MLGTFAVGIPVCSRHRRSHRRLHAVTSSCGDIDPEVARTLGQCSVDGERASCRCHLNMLAPIGSIASHTYPMLTHTPLSGAGREIVLTAFEKATRD